MPSPTTSARALVAAALSVLPLARRFRTADDGAPRSPWSAAED